MSVRNVCRNGLCFGLILLLALVVTSSEQVLLQLHFVNTRVANFNTKQPAFVIIRRRQRCLISRHKKLRNKSRGVAKQAAAAELWQLLFACAKLTAKAQQIADSTSTAFKFKIVTRT